MKKISVMFLACTFLCAQSLAAGVENETEAETNPIDPIKILKQVKQDLDGLTADFEQYELVGSDKVDVNSGQVWMKTPSLFRWHYKEPFEQLIVADGEQVWVYDEDLEQVTVKAQDNQLNPIYVIINDDESQQHYLIKHELSNQGTDWISLTPRVHNDEIESVWLAVEGQTLKQIKVHNKFSQTMVFEFFSIQRNPEFKKGLFSFTPPEGVDIVRAIAGEFE